MNPNSFRLDNKMTSFKLDREIAYYYHRLREVISEYFFSLLGAGQTTTNLIKRKITNVEFNEPIVLFEAIIKLFNKILKGFDIVVYKYQKYDNSLVLYIGEPSKYDKRVFFDDNDINYLNEKRAIAEDSYCNNIKIYGIGGKAVVHVNGYVISFYHLNGFLGGKIRMLNAIFKVGFADIIRSKLLLMESKYIDPRTGLYNAKFIKDIARNKSYSVIKADIDDFKMVNDTYGHAVGDKVLEDLGKVFKSSIGVEDKGCRDGGDESILFIDSDDEIIINKIIDRINDQLYKLNERYHFMINISMGTSIYKKGKSFKKRIEEADTSMYSKKNKNSQVYRLAKKISEIKDPELYKELVKHVVSNSPSIDIIKKAIKDNS